MAINAGLIGFGLAGKAFHAPLIHAVDGLELTGIATSRSAEAGSAYPACRIFASASDLIAHPAIDLVVIATPNATHAPLARAALDAGKHVVVDKPFVTDAAEGARLIARAQAAGRMLTVFHNRRWDGDFLTVRRLLAAGMLGPVTLAQMHWDRLRPAIKPGWREQPGDGAGLLADLGPHLIDQALVLFGPPRSIGADIAIQRDAARVDDYFALTLDYGRLRVSLSASTLVAAPRPRFALYGAQGSFVKHGLDPQEAVLRAGDGPDAPGFGMEDEAGFGCLTRADGTTERVPTERGDWREFYRRLATGIGGGGTPPQGRAPVDPDDALATVDLLALARRSAAERRLLPIPD